MGNIFCPQESITNLASIARDVCPFPDYTPSPLFINMMSVNSSRHLNDHYTAVQSSLNPKQLEDFTQSLRSTFGREGRVSYGGVGVVALSLAVLFDTLAKQAKGEWVSDSGPIPGLFLKDLRGYYPPRVYTVSEYLRLVPHIANNPTRMREEAERCLKRMKTESESLNTTDTKNLPLTEDIVIMNSAHAQMFGSELKSHYLRINGTQSSELFEPEIDLYDDITINLNCDPRMADKEFLDKVQKSDPQIQQTLTNLQENTNDPLVLLAARADVANSIFKLTNCAKGYSNSDFPQREDFDLRANALGKWEV